MEMTLQPEEAASGPEEVATQHFNKWAILIGIDKYTHDGSLKRKKRESTSGMEMNDPKNLRGAVNDVLAVRNYLETVMNMDPKHIKVLLAPAEDTEHRFPLPGKTEYKEPTYENIVNALAEVPRYAKEGDLVYIHYSGHGGQATTVFPGLQHKGDGGIDHALLPADLACEGRYLRDVELGALLQDIAAVGTVLTVVLDCCHSGGAIRGKDDDDDDITNVRGVEVVYRSVQEVDRVLAPASEASVARWVRAPVYQSNTTDKKLAPALGAIQVSRWMGSSDGFVVLAACLETQKAKETMGVGSRFFHGQLTYWLLDTLRLADPGLSSADIYGRVSAKIRNAVTDQTPYLFDNSDRFFFGPKHRAKVYAVRVLSVGPRQDQIKLAGGHMHGIKKKAEYVILRLGFELDRRIQDADVLARVKITAVQSGESTAVILVSSEQQTLIQEGCPAVLQRLPPEAQAAVRFLEADEGQREQFELGWSDHERKSGHGLLRLLNSEEEDFSNTLFTVTVKDNIFQIKDGSDMLSGAAADPLPWETPDGIPRLVRRLEHVAIYHRLRELKNISRRTAGVRDLVKSKTTWAPRDEVRGLVDAKAIASAPTGEVRDLVDVEIAPAPEDLVTDDDELLPAAEAMPQNGSVYEVPEKHLFRITVTNKCEEPVGCTILNLNPGLGITVVYPPEGNYCIIPGSVQGQSEGNSVFEDFYVDIPKDSQGGSTKNAGAAEAGMIPDLFKVLVSKPPGLDPGLLRLAKLRQMEQGDHGQRSDQANDEEDESLRTLKALLDKLKPATRDAVVARKSPDKYKWQANNIEVRAVPQS
ncbi:hypothetical protein RB595_004098 [Gaeumannomyces hyphopodioides]